MVALGYEMQRPFGYKIQHERKVRKGLKAGAA